jgi:rhodanese-related sulfurtransferase/glyoxylase-like metal-dependent hydrolase (beta-lactamase superfamily II)
VILKQHYLGCLSHASYLVADEASKTAAVVDPRRDVDEYLAEARRLGLDVRHVVLTHFHADFVSGHIELREKTGAEIVLGWKASAEYPFRAVREGDEIVLGPNVRLRVLETPGHTPEAISLVVHDRARGDAPQAVLTGDTLFVGDVGRPDLLASQGMAASDLAGMLHASLGKLRALPDETLVYPAHGAGSMCGKNLGSETYSTIGAQRRTNPMLREMPRAEFVSLVTADQPQAPGYFAYDAELNRRARPTLDDALARELRPLSLDDVLAARDADTQVLDVREPAAFAAGHLPGSVNVGLSGKYATWAGTLLDRERPIVLVAEAGREREAAVRLGRIGFDQVRGYLEGGTSALAARADLLATAERVDPLDAQRLLESAPETAVIDVRTAAEWRGGHVPGAKNVPLDRLSSRLDEVPRDRPLLLHCQSGYRSSTAASLLRRAGYSRLTDLAGGMNAWRLAGLPAPTDEAAARS